MNKQIILFAISIVFFFLCVIIGITSFVLSIQELILFSSFGTMLSSFLVAYSLSK